MLITAKSLNTLKLDCVRLSLIDNAFLNVPCSIVFLHQKIITISIHRKFQTISQLYHRNTDFKFE